MGDLFECALSGLPISTYSVWLENFEPQNVDIASLGPATLVPKVVKHLGSSNCNVLLMGHLIKSVPNFKGEEFNFVLDIPNFEWCLKNTDCVVATLDTCRADTFNLAGKFAKGDSIFAKLLNTSIQFAQARHLDNAFVYDYIAVRYFVNKEFNTECVVDKRGNAFNQLIPKSSIDLLDISKHRT
jgi:inosine-uridine nucleoside N-ribohydrolase